MNNNYNNSPVMTVLGELVVNQQHVPVLKK